MPEHQHRSDADKIAADSGDGDGKTSIGELLRKQRKARGISMVEIAEHTKIGKKYLEALENDDYQVLPGETYTRGFLRAYAKYLELDDVELLNQYREQKAGLATEVNGGAERVRDKSESNQSLWGPLLAVVVLAGLGAGLFLFWPAGHRGRSESRAEAQPNTGLESLSAPVLASTTAGGDLSLKIRAKAKTWVTLMVDGRQEPDVTLNAGEERTWSAKDRFVLWTGNAGGIELTFNGELQPPLGQVNEVRKEVVFERKPGGAEP